MFALANPARELGIPYYVPVAISHQEIGLADNTVRLASDLCLSDKHRLIDHWRSGGYSFARALNPLVQGSVTQVCELGKGCAVTGLVALTKPYDHLIERARRILFRPLVLEVHPERTLRWPIEKVEIGGG